MCHVLRYYKYSNMIVKMFIITKKRKENSPSLLFKVWFTVFQIFPFMSCTYFLAASTFWCGRRISALSSLEMPDHSAVATGAVVGSFHGRHPTHSSNP